MLYNQLLDRVDHAAGKTHSPLVPISTSEKLSGLNDVISVAFASYTPLNQKDFRDIKQIYWARSDFNSAKTKTRGVLKWGSNKGKTTRTANDAESIESESDGNEKVGVLLFLVDKHGKVLSESHQKDIRSFQRSIWYTLLSFNLAPVAWSKVNSIAQLYYYGCMRTRFPELQLCKGDWKAEAMAVEYYHGWVDRPTSTTVKSESKEVKIKNEKSHEPSLALAASSSKRPTSLTIQSEHVKKQKTSLDARLGTENIPAPTSTSMKPVPAPRPALQVSRNNIF
jgi:hypothetical protein